MHRFFISAELLQEKHVVLTGPQAHQINDVLRMKAGDSIIVLDNTGYEYIVTLMRVERRQVIGEVVNQRKSEAEPRTRITLYQSLLAREKFELVLQKCTEVGVSHFVPIVTQRSLIRQPQAITPKKMSRWQSIITEAAEQSGRGKIPTLESPLLFRDTLAGLDDFDCCLVGSAVGNEADLRNILPHGDIRPVRIALLIGPEGGFTDEEIAEACGRGAKAFSLGKRILRTETAAIVASALILHELDR
jgi:16S rRNA (uracil1498-N3)-methyltransferase